MSKEEPDVPKAVFKCKDKNCTKPHYHLDPQVEKNEAIEKEGMPDRPIVELGKDKKND